MVRVFVLTVGSLLCALVALFFIPRSWPPSVGGRVAHHHLCTSCGTHRVTRMAAGLQLGGNESYPGIFQPFGGFGQHHEVVDGAIAIADTPGTGLEHKQELRPVLAELVPEAFG